MAFDSTIGGANSNSYITLAAAEAYFLGRLSDTAWDEADESTREAACIMATSRLDAEPFVGSVVSSTQRLQWPRYGAYDRSGYAYVATAIPRPIQEATFELALMLLNDPDAFGGDSGLSEFQNLRIGSLDVTPRVAPSWVLPANVLRLLYPLRLGGFQNRVVRA
jgi:DnaT-like ssDNA binding protein